MQRIEDKVSDDTLQKSIRVVHLWSMDTGYAGDIVLANSRNIY